MTGRRRRGLRNLVEEPQASESPVRAEDTDNEPDVEQDDAGQSGADVVDPGASTEETDTPDQGGTRRSAGSGDDTAAEAERIAAEQIERAKRGYTVGTWRGLPNYQCIHCQFAAVDDVERIEAHVFERHRRAAFQVRDSNVLDSRGNPVQVAEEIDPDKMNRAKSRG